jgi:hypothetical protein
MSRVHYTDAILSAKRNRQSETAARARRLCGSRATEGGLAELVCLQLSCVPHGALTQIQEYVLSSLHRTHSPVAFTEVDAETILAYITARQHLHPHQPVRDVLEGTTIRYGCCPQAIQRAVQWLGLDDAGPIGRLRRSQIIQLARAVHRLWMQNASAASAPTA